LKSPLNLLFKNSSRYMRLADKLSATGQTDRAYLCYALAIAYKLAPKWQEPNVRPGEYFRPTGPTGAYQDAEMALLRKPETLAFLRQRLGRTAKPIRKARLADTLWEFDRDVNAARAAIDFYARTAADEIYGPNIDAHLVASCLGRAISLSYVINDWTSQEPLLNLIYDAFEQIVKSREIIALTYLINALLNWKQAPKELLVREEDSLMEVLCVLHLCRQNNYFVRQSVLGLLFKIEKALKGQSKIRLVELAIGEAMVAEADRQPSVSNGAMIAMSYYEQAAKHFEKLGDRSRASELRALERNAGRQVKWGVIMATGQIDLRPYRQRLVDLFGSALPSTGQKLGLWSALAQLAPPPTEPQIEEAIKQMRVQTPLVSTAPMTNVEGDLEREAVSPEEALRRRAMYQVYLEHGMDVAALLLVANNEFGIVSSQSFALLDKTGRFDEMGRELLQRLLKSFDEKDWISLALAAAPLFEKLVRVIALEAGLEVKFQDTNGGRIRLNYKSIEALLLEIPIDNRLKGLVAWLACDHGRNLRNKVGHGYIQKAECEGMMGSHILYAVVALAFTPLLKVGD
jgi:hypothetical protein